jgi:hypothetical protein
MSAQIRGHEHIAGLFWRDDASGLTGYKTRPEMVSYVKTYGVGSVWCPDQYGGSGQWVHTNTNGRVEYVQTFADGRWTDNLLALPER